MLSTWLVRNQSCEYFDCQWQRIHCGYESLGFVRLNHHYCRCWIQAVPWDFESSNPCDGKKSNTMPWIILYRENKLWMRTHNDFPEFSDSYSVQWPAVNIQSLSIIDPPQWEFPKLSKAICHGASSMLISSPPTTRFRDGFNLNARPIEGYKQDKLPFWMHFFGKNLFKWIYFEWIP